MLMKCLLLDHPGPPESLRLGSAESPLPGPGDVRVTVKAVGLNPADYKFLVRGIGSWSYPHIPGLDGAGVIDALGPGVSGWSIGDAVLYHGDFGRSGSFAEQAVTSAISLVRKPEALSFVEAAALPCSGFTAYQVLHDKLNIRADQTLLVQGGAGGVGGFAIQLAARMGLRVITTAAGRNAEWVRALGAEINIDYTCESVAERIAAITCGAGVDAIVDTVGPVTATEGLKMLAYGGGIACVAGLPDFSQMKSFGNAISVHDIALGGAYRAVDDRPVRRLAATGEAFIRSVISQNIQPMLTEVIRLEMIPEALVRLSSRTVRGKIVAELGS